VASVRSSSDRSDFSYVFYQVRVSLYAHLFSVVPLTFLLRDGLAWVRERYKGRKLFSVEAGLVLFAPLVGLLLPAVIDGRSFNKGVLLFPVMATKASACATDGVWEILTLPSYYGDRPRLIMNSLNEGAPILFRTHHRVLSGPYHTNVRGNGKALAFFRAKE
jgi:hypothetical protein